MVDHSDDPRPKPIRRIEVITGGGGRRRRWGEEEKARIVAESFAPGAVVAEVARRHDTRAQQVHGWRRDAREGRLALPAERAHGVLNFAPVVIAPPALPATKAAARARCGARPAAAIAPKASSSRQQIPIQLVAGALAKRFGLLLGPSPIIGFVEVGHAPGIPRPAPRKKRRSRAQTRLA